MIPKGTRCHATVQRLLDVVLSLLFLALAAFPMVLIALTIRLTSRGPALYLQQRVGLGGRLFRILKFRTMIEGADKQGTSVTAKNDARITAVGGFLRKTKLDELPQLFNILKGEMSIVGPRPDVPAIVNTYTDTMRQILTVKPGLTSLATLHLRNEEELLAHVADPDSFYEQELVPVKVKLALEHVERCSLAFDLKVLALTLWVVMFGHGRTVPEHPAVRQLKQRALSSAG
jgi:lipopolysaccharide/colanic/teichoic acid biosynthesis glycosyltransferase